MLNTYSSKDTKALGLQITFVQVDDIHNGDIDSISNLYMRFISAHAQDHLCNCGQEYKPWVKQEKFTFTSL